MCEKAEFPAGKPDYLDDQGNYICGICLCPITDKTDGVISPYGTAPGTWEDCGCWAHARCHIRENLHRRTRAGLEAEVKQLKRELEDARTHGDNLLTLLFCRGA